MSCSLCENFTLGYVGGSEHENVCYLCQQCGEIIKKDVCYCSRAKLKNRFLVSVHNHIASPDCDFIYCQVCLNFIEFPENQRAMLNKISSLKIPIPLSWIEAIMVGHLVEKHTYLERINLKCNAQLIDGNKIDHVCRREIEKVISSNCTYGGGEFYYRSPVRTWPRLAGRTAFPFPRKIAKHAMEKKIQTTTAVQS